MRNCHLLDLRNHGDSDHHDSMNYREMVEDVIRYADKERLGRFTLLGHSMGAKTAMALAVLHPERIDGVIVVEAPPIIRKNTKGVNTKIVELVCIYTKNR